MKPAREMTLDELAHHLRYYFKHPPAEGLGFVRSFIGRVKKGWPTSPKMRRKAEHMVDESYAEAEIGSLLEDGDV